MPNADLVRLRKVSSFRRIAALAWPAPVSPAVYGAIEVRADALTTWLDAQNRSQQGPHLTVTHAVARAVGLTLARHPDVNVVVRWGRLYQRRSADVFLEVAVPRGESPAHADLSGVCVRQADQKSVHAIAAEVAAAAARIRGGDDRDFERTKQEARWLPPTVMRVALRLLQFLQWGLNLDTSALGAPRDPFGSAMVSSMGMFGVRSAFAPFFPLGRAPIIMVVGEIHDRVVAEGGQPVVRRILPIGATLDHRIIDGLHAAALSKTLVGLLESPELLEPARAC